MQKFADSSCMSSKMG